MLVTLWRIGVFMLIAFGLVGIAANVASPTNDGALPFSLQGRGDGSYQVTALKPQAAALPVHTGDILTLGPDSANRIRFARAAAGDTIVFTSGDGRRIDVRVGPAPQFIPKLGQYAWFTIVALYLVIAALLAVRKFDDLPSRSLAGFLACFGCGMSLFSAFATPWLRIVASVTDQVILVSGLAMLLVFATTFPNPDARGLRAIARLAAPWLAAVMISSAIAATAIFLLTGSPSGFGTSTAYFIATLLTIALIIPSFVLSILTSRGSDRARMMWLAATFGVGLSGLLVQLIYVLVTRRLDSAALYAGFLLGLIPIGLAYVILRHRVLDITFVINRAIVYAIVSACIVGSFMALEWLIGHFVEGRFENMALQFASSLALGLSARYIHQRVDTFVDDIFFRDRHRAEAAVRTFAAESLMITDAGELLFKTIDVAQRNFRLSGVAIYTHDGNGYRLAGPSTLALPESVGENDYVVLSLRTWFTPRSLDEPGSAITGEAAFPMRVRGRLSGFLVSGPKLSGEAMAPDERAALSVLAHDVGIALETLRISEIEQRLAVLSALPTLQQAQPAG